MRPLQFGVTYYAPGLTEPGYVLWGPMGGSECFLMGERGELVHQQRLPGRGNCYGQLLENGNLLIAARAGKGIKGLNAAVGRLLEIDPRL